MVCSRRFVSEALGAEPRRRSVPLSLHLDVHSCSFCLHSCVNVAALRVAQSVVWLSAQSVVCGNGSWVTRDCERVADECHGHQQGERQKVEAPLRRLVSPEPRIHDIQADDAVHGRED